MAEEQGLATSVDGCRIAWRWDGEPGRPVVILSHSLGVSMAMWDDQVKALGGEYRILRYDTRGHGGSDAPSGDYSLDRLGRDVLAVMDHLGIASAHFCGLSLGGMTGQWLAVHAAERIERLVIANSSAHMGPAEGWQQRIATVRAEGMAAITGAVLERWFTPAFLGGGAPGVERTRRMLLATSPDGYAGCCAAIRDMDLRPIIRLIASPTLVIAGSLDPATPAEHSELIRARIAGASLATLPAAHLSNIEQPDGFNAALRAFLGQQSSG
jgi:3-oxoadipate enol-lactonase